MPKNLKGLFDGKGEDIPKTSQTDAHDRCVKRILRIHNMAIVSSGEEREKGLEDLTDEQIEKNIRDYPYVMGKLKDC